VDFEELKKPESGGELPQMRFEEVGEGFKFQSKQIVMRV
jgi:hypothetical protein